MVLSLCATSPFKEKKLVYEAKGPAKIIGKHWRGARGRRAAARLGHALRRALLQAARKEEVQYGADVALVGRDGPPERLRLLRQLIAVAPRHIVQALQQPLAPVACTRAPGLLGTAEGFKSFRAPPHGCSEQGPRLRL